MKSLLVVLLLVAAAVGGISLLGRRILFPRTNLSPDQIRQIAASRGWSIAHVPRPDEGIELIGLVKSSTDAAAPWVLFFGGNGFDLGGSQLVLEQVAARASRPLGLAVFAYRGYDGSGGTPSERAVIADAHEVVRWLERTHGVGPDRLVVAGQSLGSGVAAHVAAKLSDEATPPRAVVLLSAYTSIAALFEERVPLIGWAVRDPIRTDRIIPKIRAPVVLIHGTEDRLIGVEHSRALTRALGDRARLVELDRRTHNDLWSDPRTAEAFASVLR